MAAANTPMVDVEARVDIATVGATVGAVKDTVAKLDDRLTKVDDKLDQHMQTSGSNYTSTQAKLDAVNQRVDDKFAAFDSKIDGKFKAVDDKLDTVIKEMKAPSGFMVIIRDIVHNPVKGAQFLIFLATLGSIVAAFGAWLGGGPLPEVPQIPTSIVQDANGASLKDDKPTEGKPESASTGDTDVP